MSSKHHRHLLPLFLPVFVYISPFLFHCLPFTPADRGERILPESPRVVGNHARTSFQEIHYAGSEAHQHCHCDTTRVSSHHSTESEHRVITFANAGSCTPRKPVRAKRSPRHTRLSHREKNTWRDPLSTAVLPSVPADKQSAKRDTGERERKTNS